MGLFDAFVNDKSNLWPGHILETMDEFETILKASFSIPQLIFKHSTRCNISHIVKNDFISNYGFSSDDFGLWHLDLLAHRTVSNAISQQLGVVHQSPQLIVIKNGKALKSASHENIRDVLLSKFLN